MTLMALIKRNVFFTSLLILVALFGVAVGGTVHKVGDSSGWTMIGVDYEGWTSSKKFQVGDSLIFEYNNEYHDVAEVSSNDFKLCDPSKPLAMHQTGSDTISLTKPGLHHFICGVPGHCDLGQKLQVYVFPTSLGPVAAPVPRPVRSKSSSSSPSLSPLVDAVNNAPQYNMGPSQAQHNAASASNVWIKFSFVALLSFFLS